MYYHAVIARWPEGSPSSLPHTGISRIHEDEPTGGIRWAVLARFKTQADARLWQGIYRRLIDNRDGRYLMEQVAP